MVQGWRIGGYGPDSGGEPGRVAPVGRLHECSCDFARVREDEERLRRAVWRAHMTYRLRGALIALAEGNSKTLRVGKIGCSVALATPFVLSWISFRLVRDPTPPNTRKDLVWQRDFGSQGPTGDEPVGVPPPRVLATLTFPAIYPGRSKRY